MFEDLNEDKKSALSGPKLFSADFLRAWYIGAIVGAIILGALTMLAGRPGNPMQMFIIFVGGGGAVGAIIGMIRKRKV